jgi:truncated hemoglobin YjbI
MSSGMSYFEELGGTPTVKEAVDRFYRLVLDDGELATYFHGVDLPQLKAHQVKLISHVLGGPNEYAGRELAAAHSNLGVTEAHYQKVGAYLTGVLTEMGAREEIVVAVGTTLASVAPQIIAQPGDGAGAP